MQFWYLIQTKSGQENTARINLERQGYKVYLPIAPVRRRRRGKTYLESGPMFPLYLFINLSEGIDDWGPIRSTIGVARLVRFGQVPAQLPDRLIQALKSREDVNGVQIIMEREYESGDKIRIIEGPFEGYEAIIHSKSAKERTVILLKLAENHVKLELNSKYLEPLSR